MTWALLLGLLLTAARAEMPLPSYAEATSLAAWHEVNHLIERGRYAEAIERGAAFERIVAPSPGVAYLTGLAYRFLDDTTLAERHLRRATTLDPSYPAPWSDLGELLLVQGRYDEARVAFDEVARLVATGPGSAIGPRRLAEIAAHQGDAEAFEAHIREALRRGFSFRDIAGLPNWQRFYADPHLHDSVVKMITVYGDQRVLETLTPPQAADAHR